MTISTIEAERKRRIERLKPYQFKPGNRANPKGRPKAIITKKEKLEILTEIARHVIEGSVTAGHKIAAIKEANLMEHVYEEGIREPKQLTNIVFVLPNGTRLGIGQIGAGDVQRQIEAEGISKEMGSTKEG